MISKKIFIFLIFFSLTACGYQAIYSQKNISLIQIKEIIIEEDKKINQQILSFVNLNTKNTKEGGYVLNLSSKMTKDIVAKNSSGNAKTYKITLQATVLISEDGNKQNIYKKKLFNSSFTYNDKKNKFELSQDEKNIEENLSETIARQIIVYLSS
tara:strand:- start:96 stop:560 length:465 start_codon:yes stop_codon:yes gene_type:complete